MGYRYIGSKARISEEILSYIGKPEKEGFFIDAFSGTGVVGETACDFGWNVHVNDMLKSASIMSESRLISEMEAEYLFNNGLDNTINCLNDLQGIEGFFWREYSPASIQTVGIGRQYFTETNAKKIDAIISQIKIWKARGDINAKEESVLYASLMLATNDVANIAGTYGCFLSNWTKQAMNDICLRPIKLKKDRKKYVCTNIDVFQIESTENDLVYLDPPYTKRQYASYYHILESIVMGDAPMVEGVSGLRPWKDKASVFCYKRKALDALVELITKQKAYRVVVSYSDDGHIVLDELLHRLQEWGSAELVEISTIGRYTPNKTAINNKTDVKEYLVDFRKGIK